MTWSRLVAFFPMTSICFVFLDHLHRHNIANPIQQNPKPLLTVSNEKSNSHTVCILSNNNIKVIM